MTAYVDSARRAVRTLTEREQRLLLQVTGARRDGFRDHVFFSLALGTGLREHEILALTLRDVFDEAGRAKRRIVLRVFKRSTTNPAPQEVVLPDRLRGKLDKFFTARRQAGAQWDDPLFVSRLGKRLSARRVRAAFVLWQQRAGFERTFNVHALRHAACTNFHRRCRDLRLTQRFARHASVVTTGIYAHPSDEELERAAQDLIC